MKRCAASSVEALREIGYQVLEAGDAMEGVRLIVDRGGIDLLFTDVGLPGGVNGRALADAARSAQPGLRVLFTTGYTRSADPAQTACWIDDVHFIAKPFNLDCAGGEDPRGARGPPTTRRRRRWRDERIDRTRARGPASTRITGPVCTPTPRHAASRC